MVQITYTPEPGETKKKRKGSAKAEEILLDRKHVDTVQYTLGAGNPLMGGSSNGALFYIKYEEDTPDLIKKGQCLKRHSEAIQTRRMETQDFSSSGNNNELTYYVYGDSEKRLKAL
ncbi:hypothetical protein PO124_14175 [Bacillus licheniformis]|nr:hypothetical protein [Bacillus licheniformis]